MQAELLCGRRLTSADLQEELSEADMSDKWKICKNGDAEAPLFCIYRYMLFEVASLRSVWPATTGQRTSASTGAIQLSSGMNLLMLGIQRCAGDFRVSVYAIDSLIKNPFFKPFANVFKCFQLWSGLCF